MTTQLEEIETWAQEAINAAVHYLPKLLLAILTLIIGFWIVRLVSRGLRKVFQRNNMEKALADFLLSFIRMTLKVLVIVSVITMVGVETTSILTVLGAAGLAVGLALQGSLANLAGGVLILMFRPFKVGDYVEGADGNGIVESINIMYTRLRTWDNKVVIVPNGKLADATVTNATMKEQRRVDLPLGISYGDDIRTARKILLDLAARTDKALKDPEPSVVVVGHGDSAINIDYRVWCATEDYWEVFWHLYEESKYALEAGGCTIPFPQRDLHLFSSGKPYPAPSGSPKN